MVRRVALPGLVLIALAWAGLAGAQETPRDAPPQEEAPIGKTDAADLAGDLALEASTLSASDPSSDGEEALQRHLEEIASLAASLETSLRSGAEKSTTRPLYQRLRRERLKVIALAMAGKVALSSDDAAVFEDLIQDLGRYHAE